MLCAAVPTNIRRSSLITHTPAGPSSASKQQHFTATAEGEMWTTYLSKSAIVFSAAGVKSAQHQHACQLWLWLAVLSGVAATLQQAPALPTDKQTPPQCF
jgi:hypothetical protein